MKRRRRRRKISFKRPILLAVLFFLIFTGFAAFFYIPQIRIKDIAVENDGVLNSEELKKSVKQIISEKYLGIFPKNNIFLLPKKEIKQRIFQEFLRVENISVSRDLFSGVIVSVIEKKGKAIWCYNYGAVPLAGRASSTSSGREDRFITNQKCAFVDGKGIIFETAPVFSGRVFLKFMDERSQKPGLGNIVVLEQEFKKITKLKNFLEDEFRVKTEEIVLKDDGQYELITEESWSLFLNEQNKEKELLENLKIALEREIKEKIGSLEYLDLRFGSKVFYKFR